MSESPFISVIVPTYNCGWCIQTAIGSVLSQTFEDYEIIVVDDGSTDDTPARLGNIHDRRLRYIEQENAGRAQARNTGIKLAKGEWLAFLDADDLWLPMKLERQVAAIRANPAITLVYSQAYLFSDRDLQSGETADITAGQLIGSGRLVASDCLHEFLMAHFAIQTSTVIARMVTVNELGGFDHNLHISEDLDLFMRLAWKGLVCFIPEPLAGYWLGPYQNHYERGRQYNWHNELLGVAEKNLKLTGLSQTDPAFARRVLAIWEWRCAIVDRGIGRLDSAKLHAARAFEHQPHLAEDDEFLQEMCELLINVLGIYGDNKIFRDELRSVISDLIPITSMPDMVYKKVLGFRYESRAFRAFSDGKALFGLTNSVRASFNYPKLFGNRGMWITGFKALLKTVEA